MTLVGSVTVSSSQELVAHPSWGKRLIGIEGLRGFAALAVLFSHVGQHLFARDELGAVGRLSGLGGHGLTLFFALSGFLLFRPFASAVLNGTAFPDLGRYALNRALRILPAYIVIFLLVSLVFGVAYTEGAPGVHGYDAIGYLTEPGKILANLFLVQTYIPSMVLTGLGTAWSLTTEIAFYIALPLVALLAALAARRINRLLAVLIAPATLIVVGLVTTSIMRTVHQGDADLQWGHNWSAVFDRSLLAQADLFGYGMLVAVVVVALRNRGLRVARRWWIGGALAAAVVIGGASILFGGTYATNGMGIASSLLILATVLPASVEGSAGNNLARMLEWLPFRYLGLVSYSVYLWHLPVVLWMFTHDVRVGYGVPGLILTTFTVAVVTVGLATVTYFLVERPTMNLKLKQRTKAPGA